MLMRLSYALSVASGAICSGFLEHPILLGAACLVAYVLAFEQAGGSRVQKIALGFCALIGGALALFPISCVTEKAANATYGREEVRKEYVRLESSELYLHGQEAAKEAYREIKKSVAAWEAMRNSGLCVESSKVFQHTTYGLVCADGWTGSRCGCGGGRGCCSWHGGYGHCATYIREETRTYVDGLSWTDPGGSDRFESCGGSTAQLRIKYQGLVRQASVRPVDFAWRVGWDDVSKHHPDFERVVMKVKTMPFSETSEEEGK